MFPDLVKIGETSLPFKPIARQKFLKMPPSSMHALNIEEACLHDLKIRLHLRLVSQYHFMLRLCWIFRHSLVGIVRMQRIFIGCCFSGRK